MKAQKSNPTYNATHSVDVFGWESTSKVVEIMLLSSIFFVVEPMPACVYRIYVKEEAVFQLETIAAFIKHQEGEGHE